MTDLRSAASPRGVSPVEWGRLELNQPACRAFSRDEVSAVGETRTRCLLLTKQAPIRMSLDGRISYLQSNFLRVAVVTTYARLA